MYETWDLRGSRTAGATCQGVPDEFPDPSQLSDSDLWQLVLTPVNYRMSKDTFDYLKRARIEFSKRDVNLVAIMDCNY
jgi:hypothetical protein